MPVYTALERAAYYFLCCSSLSMECNADILRAFLFYSYRPQDVIFISILRQICTGDQKMIYFHFDFQWDVIDFGYKAWPF